MRYPIYPDYTYDPENKRYYTTIPYIIQNGLFFDVKGLNKSSLPLEDLESFHLDCKKMRNTIPYSIDIDGFLIEYGKSNLQELIVKYIK